MTEETKRDLRSSKRRKVLEIDKTQTVLSKTKCRIFQMPLALQAELADFMTVTENITLFQGGVFVVPDECKSIPGVPKPRIFYCVQNDLPISRGPGPMRSLHPDVLRHWAKTKIWENVRSIELDSDSIVSRDNMKLFLSCFPNATEFRGPLRSEASKILLKSNLGKRLQHVDMRHPNGYYGPSMAGFGAWARSKHTRPVKSIALDQSCADPATIPLIKDHLASSIESLDLTYGSGNGPGDPRLYQLLYECTKLTSLRCVFTYHTVNHEPNIVRLTQDKIGESRPWQKFEVPNAILSLADLACLANAQLKAVVFARVDLTDAQRAEALATKTETSEAYSPELLRILDECTSLETFLTYPYNSKWLDPIALSGDVDDRTQFKETQSIVLETIMRSKARFTLQSIVETSKNSTRLDDPTKIRMHRQLPRLAAAICSFPQTSELWTILSDEKHQGALHTLDLVIDRAFTPDNVTTMVCTVIQNAGYMRKVSIYSNFILLIKLDLTNELMQALLDRCSSIGDTQVNLRCEASDVKNFNHELLRKLVRHVPRLDLGPFRPERFIRNTNITHKDLIERPQGRIKITDIALFGITGQDLDNIEAITDKDVAVNVDILISKRAAQECHHVHFVNSVLRCFCEQKVDDNLETMATHAPWCTDDVFYFSTE